MASARKHPLSFEEHRQNGKLLRETHNRLVELQTRLGNAYPARLGTGKFIRQALSAIGHLRDVLDDQVFDEFPEKDFLEKATIYYGGPDGLGK